MSTTDYIKTLSRDELESIAVLYSSMHYYRVNNILGATLFIIVTNMEEHNFRSLLTNIRLSGSVFTAESLLNEIESRNFYAKLAEDITFNTQSV